MKFEKINNNKLKIELTTDDLVAENLQVTDLAYGNEKTRELFHKLMERAIREVDFTIDDKPLLVEAIPKSATLIELYITKIDENEQNNAFNKLKETVQKKSSVDTTTEDVLQTNDIQPKETQKRSKIIFYSFNKLDDVIDATKAISDIFDGKSELYKTGETYLLFLNSKKINDINKLLYILDDFGTYSGNDKVTKAFLTETAQKIIKKDAVQNLSQV